MARAGAALPRKRREFYEALIQELAAFGRQQFLLRSSSETGGTLGEHIAAAERVRPGVVKRRPKDTPPEATAFLWSWYMDISSARICSVGMGALIYHPIQFSEILAWCGLHDIRLEPWQLRAIRLLDAAHVAGLMRSATEVTREELSGD